MAEGNEAAGAVACLAAMIALLVNLAAWGVLAIPRLFGDKIVSQSLVGSFYPIEYRAYTFTQTAAGFAVASTWGILNLSRRSRPEPSWIDWSGRFLGFAWIALLPVNLWTTLILQ